MTISQSRYGGAAEVGRAPSRAGRKTDNRVYGVATGAGVAGAGAIAMGHGHKYEERMGRRYGAAIDRRKAAEAAWNKGYPQNPGGKGFASRVQADAMKNELNRANANYGHNRGVFYRAKGVERALTRGGLAALGAGLLGAGLAGTSLERSRGTVGYRRPTRVEARNAQVAGRRKSIAEGQAAGDRYRRMNGM